MKDFEQRALTGDLGLALEAVKNPKTPENMLKLYGERIMFHEAQLGIPEMVEWAVASMAEVVPMPVLPEKQPAAVAA